MRLTSVILLAALMQVSASSVAQRISLSEKGTSLSRVFEKIKAQAGIDFVVSTGLLKSARPVHINVRNMQLNEVLKTIFKDQPLDYSIEDKFVVLSKKEPSMLEKAKSAIVGFILNLNVRGRVVDDKGMPLAGATITIKGTTRRTMTNDKGEFTLTGVEEKAVLVINYLGFQPKEIPASGTFLEVKLLEKAGELAEVDVVSTGYQVISRERSAGSFATVNMDVVANRTTSMNVLQSLDGQVPGLVVNNAPMRNNLLIRGLSTIGGANDLPGSTSAQPLYVVDGLAVPSTNNYDQLPDIILNLNPQDVESITVLKDATAASIWGARAANGVIVIKTKSGAFNSKLRVSYNGFVNFQGKPQLDYLPLLNSSQYVQSGIELFNSGHEPWESVSALNGGGIPPLEQILYNRERRLITEDQAGRQLDSLSNLDNRGQIKDLFYRNAMLSNQTLSLSGGSEKYSFYGSASYTNTINNVPGDKNQGYKLNIRQDIKATRFLSLYIITDLVNNKGSKKRNFEVDNRFAPYQMFRDASGRNLSIPFLTRQSDSVLRSSEARSRISLDYNPLDEFDRGNTTSDGLMARLNGGFRLDLFKGLRFEGTYGYIKGSNEIREFERLQSYAVRREIVSFTVAATPATTPRYYLPVNGGRLTNINGDQHKWDIRNQLLYDNTWGKHAVTALAGQEAQEDFNKTLRSRVRGFDETLLTHAAIDWATIAAPVLNTVLPTISTLASSMVNDSFMTNENTTRFTSYYANLGYTFDRKYTFNASWRNDQSNLFGKDKSAQNKPAWSAGGKWNIGYEDFMKPLNWVNRLSVRFTYGIMGNSPNVGVAASQDITSPTGSAFFPGSIGLLITTPGNPNLSWERTAATNIGLDFSVLNDRLSGNIDLYRKNTTDLLGIVFPNILTGFTSVTGNQGHMKNTGIELSLNAANIRSRNFSWNTSWIFAYNKNEIIKLNTGTPITTGGQQVQQQVKEGYPVFTLFAYRYAGLSNTGAPLINLTDSSQSAVRNIAKPEDLAYMGTTQPVWNGGLTNTFQYKNLRLSANMVYNMGHVMRRERNISFNRPLTANVHVDFLSRWKVPGDEAFTDIPGLVNSTANDISYFTLGDNNVVDASFVKLRDVTLFYDLPKWITGRVKAQAISFRVQLSNVMLWKANKYDLDPEFYGAIPSNQHTITLGANVSF